MNSEQNLQTTVDTLFNRVVSILESARANVVQSVNCNTVVANWLIGREIVLVIQAGDERAEYGKRIIETLSEQLTTHFGKGFSSTNLWYFRQFYQVFQNRTGILYPSGGESGRDPFIAGFTSSKSCELQIVHPVGGQSVDRFSDSNYPFSPRLSWSHYRALMRVKDPKEREFYELYLPSEEVLANEIMRERRLIENVREDGDE